MPSRFQAMAAAGVLLLAAAGQLALERARANGDRPTVLAAIALAASAGLAVAAFRKRDFLPGPPRPLEAPRYPRALYLACLPGAFALLLALAVHLGAPSGSPLTAGLWLLGLVLLLLPGAVDLRRRMRHRSHEAARETRRFLAAASTLFVFAFGVRIAGGIDRVPGWIDGDEAGTAIAGRSSLSEGPRSLFAFSEMTGVGLVSIPRMAFYISQLVARPFGQELKGLRLGSAVLGSLAVVLLFDFARRLVGSGTAFFAALLLSVNHAFVHYSRVGQIYVDTPFFASLVLALLLRAMTGGSFLALTGAGIALGIGAATYLPTVILPAVVAAVLAGWAISLRWRSKDTVVMLGFLGVLCALTCAPVVATALHMTFEVAYQRVPAISLLRADGFRQLAHAYGVGGVGEAIQTHVLRTVSLFSFGSDHFKAYGANRALNDAVTAALVPAAYALAFTRLSTPIGWMSVMFTGAYLSGGVLFCAAPPTYHRILVVLLFSSLTVAWAMTGLARLLAARVTTPRWLPAVAAIGVVSASAWLNLHYYFRELPRTRLLDAGLGLGKLICRYADTRTVIDATVLDGREYVPIENFYPKIQCAGAERIRVRETARLWRFPESTRARRVVLIVPTVVESANPGEPSGYRLMRRYVDQSIQRPARVPLSVLEFERAP